MDTLLVLKILVAVLLGLFCGSISWVALMRKRYREELKKEVNRNTIALRRRHLQLAMLQQVTEAASRSLDPLAVYEQMAKSMAHLTDAAQAAVYVPDLKDSQHLYMIENVCVRPTEFPHRSKIPLTDSLEGKCFQNGMIVPVFDNLPQYLESDAVRAPYQAHNLQAFVAVPIAGERATLGVVSLFFDVPYNPDEEDERLFRLVGRAVGAALERAETHMQARRYATDLASLYRFSQELAGQSEEKKLIETAAAASQRMLNAQASALFLVEGEGDTSTIRCAAFDGPTEKGNEIRRLPLRPDTPGLIATALRENRTVGVGIRGLSSTSSPIADTWTESNAIVVPLPPLATGGPAAGVLVACFEPHRTVGVEEIGLTEETARQTGAGLRRSRLIETTRKQAAELLLLEQIGRALHQRLSIADTLEQLVQNVNKIIAVKWATVFVHDPVEKVMVARATTLPNPAAKEIKIPLGSQSLVVSCYRTGQTLVAPDMQNDPRCNPELNRQFQTASGVCVPLGPPTQRFGVLMVNNPTAGTFTHDEVRRLEQVAQLSSAAVERARLYDDLRQRADELILLNEVGHLLAENPALDSTLQRIAERICRNFNAADAVFLLVNPRRDALISQGAFGQHSGEIASVRIPLPSAEPGVEPLAEMDLIARVFRNGQMVIVEDASRRRHTSQLLQAMPEIQSGAIIPMASVEGPVGVLTLWKTNPQTFQPRDLQSLNGVARLAASAVRRDELGQALRASEARLQEVVDGLHAMVLSIDTNGRIQSFNATAERISGIERDVAMGQKLSEIASNRPGDRIRVDEAIAAAFKGGDRLKEIVVNWTTRYRQDRRIRLSGSFLRSPDGRPGGMVVLGIDITDQLLLEAQLLQAQKMESVGTLAGGMAHDFNNLLGGIIGQCLLGRSQLDKGDPLEDCLQRIESAAHRGADLTAKLLAFSRKSVLQPREVEIAAVITETTELLSGSLPRGIQVVKQIAGSLPAIHGDPTQLQQVVLNLCVNARDAMPNGGVLTLSAFEEQFPQGLPSANGGPAVVIEVSDTGTGMSEEVQHRLFEPFFTTKEPGKGTGLGLSVVFGIIRSHSGQIKVESDVGKGTRFTIRLPGCKREQGKTTRPRGGTRILTRVTAADSGLQRAIPFAGSETVLLIDDEHILRETTQQLLQNIGYKVKTASGGAGALKLLDGEDFRPDVVLLDVVMPGLAGLPLLLELKKRLPDAPVILMSGYSADKSVQDLLAGGARQLIQKPFTLDELAGAIRQHLNPDSRAEDDIHKSGEPFGPPESLSSA